MTFVVSVFFSIGCVLGFFMAALLSSSIANRRLESIARIHELAKPNCFETCGCGNCTNLKAITKICEEEVE